MAIRPTTTLRYHREPEQAGKAECQLCQESYGHRASYFCSEGDLGENATYAFVAHDSCFASWAMRWFGLVCELAGRPE